MYTYNATIIRVVDADTIDAQVDVGFSITINHRFRLSNYDAPETWRPKTESERTHGQKATKRAVELLLNKTLKITTEKDIGIYGRYICSIELEDGKDFVTVMKEEGFEKLDQQIYLQEQNEL